MKRSAPKSVIALLIVGPFSVDTTQVTFHSVRTLFAKRWATCNREWCHVDENHQMNQESQRRGRGLMKRERSRSID